MDDSIGSSLLPSEVRLMIYDLLLDDNGQKAFTFRSKTPAFHQPLIQLRRTTYRLFSGAESHTTPLRTYYLMNEVVLHANILQVNRKIYEEASPLLYSTHPFDFEGHLEAILPFLSDLRPSTRSLVREISLTKRGLFPDPLNSV
jgi:hypothetical protein